MSGIKGFPTQQKLVVGQTSKNEFVTVQPSDENLRNNLDVIQRAAFRVNSATVPRTAGATTGNPTLNGSGTVVDDVATPAKVGDYVRFEDGPCQYLEIPIVEVSTNSFKLGARLPSPPVAGNTFYILRYSTNRVDSTGSTIVTVSPAPISFTKDAVTANVAEDTLVPANDIALPVKPLARIVGLAQVIPTSGTPIATGSYLQLLAATAGYVTEVEIDNTTGTTLILAFGAAASEVDQIYIPTKGLARQAIAIPAGTRLSSKASGNNATYGEVNINLFY